MDQPTGQKPVILASTIYHVRPKQQIVLDLVVAKSREGNYTGEENDGNCGRHIKVWEWLGVMVFFVSKNSGGSVKLFG